MKLEKQNNLTSVTLPNSIETIGSSAFEYCSSLSEVNLSSSLKTIGAWAFGSTALGDIDFLPEGLVRIGAGAFEGVHATTVVIPETVEYLATSNRGEFPMGNPFYNCNVLETFVGKFATEDGKALVETAPDGKTYFISYAVARDDDSYVVPEVDAISYFAFWGALSLKHIELPSSLESIYDAAFLACRSLENITIPSGIQLIGGDAFVNCRSLQWVKVLSSSVPSGRAPYAYYYGGMFRCSSGYSYDIYVPSSSVEAYKATNYWSDFADRIKPLTSLPEAVDLGLSVKWASFNLGATAPKEVGGLYSWGEITLPCTEDWSSYKWCNGDENHLTKYCVSDNRWGGEGAPDGKTILDPEDDAAAVNLGGGWRMPTIEEWEELFNNSTCEWTQQDGVYGRLITSNLNGASIFLPSAGVYDDPMNGLSGEACRYWSSSLHTWSYTAQMYLSSPQLNQRWISIRIATVPIRPVCK